VTSWRASAARIRDWAAAARWAAAHAGDPEVREALDRDRPGWRDQAAAANAEALTASSVDAAMMGSETYTDEAVDRILAGHLARLLIGVAQGTIGQCGHVDLDHPRPLFANLALDRIDCQACAPPFGMLPLGDGPQHCDLCARPLGPDDHAGITTTIGFTTLAARCCPRCSANLRREGAPA
jgi:hypothetical protein